MSLVEKKLTEKTRYTILKLKTARDKKKFDISSSHIYEAVLTGRIATLPALLTFHAFVRSAR